MRKPKSISLDDRTEKLINDYPVSIHGIDFSGRIRELVKVSSSMIKYTRIEMMNYFSVAEACLIVDVLNGTLYSGDGNPKAILYGNVEDGILLEDVDQKWGVDKDKLLEKINNLTEYQCYVVIANAFEFWDSAIETVEDDFKERLSRIFLIQKN